MEINNLYKSNGLHRELSRMEILIEYGIRLCNKEETYKKYIQQNYLL